MSRIAGGSAFQVLWKLQNVAPCAINTLVWAQALASGRTRRSVGPSLPGSWLAVRLAARMEGPPFRSWLLFVQGLDKVQSTRSCGASGRAD